MNSTIFIPIQNKEDLEKLTINQENFWCDFKQRIELSKDSVANFKSKLEAELAKDVAAFANALGGTLLIGAVEKKEMFSGFTPLNKADALKTQKKYEETVEKRCIPKPLIDIIIIENVKGKDGNEGCVVAVNIFPFPGQMIGVKMTGDANVDSGDIGYRFPIRFAKKTILLEPNQFSMFMLPEIRRKSIIFSQINQQEQLYIISKIKESDNKTADPNKLSGTISCKFIKIDEFCNYIELESSFGNLFLPIDAISLVFKSQKDWFLHINGIFMKKISGLDTGEPIFVPN